MHQPDHGAVGHADPAGAVDRHDRADEEDEHERPDELGAYAGHSGPPRRPLFGRTAQGGSDSMPRAGQGLLRADVDPPAGLALATHVPANVDARRRPRAETDHARHAPALRAPVVGPRSRIVEVLVDDGVRRAEQPGPRTRGRCARPRAPRAPAVRRRRHVPVEALVRAEQHEQAEHDQEPGRGGRPDPASGARAPLARWGSFPATGAAVYAPASAGGPSRGRDGNRLPRVRTATSPARRTTPARRRDSGTRSGLRRRPRARRVVRPDRGRPPAGRAAEPERPLRSRRQRAAGGRYYPSTTSLIVPPLLLGVAAIAWGPMLAERLSFRDLLVAAGGAAFAWAFLLAMSDGPRA